ncbi:hypothetical protein [uncultured Desulfovibrio sp.]|uniref:hypothetical protein n=1 Tax=uncultured Desulfovibrio sp. TaxID=167968 RepID=UPI00263A9BB0|nr:hypothetical protein [uncultured Desulfovibrio sp.]
MPWMIGSMPGETKNSWGKGAPEAPHAAMEWRHATAVVPCPTERLRHGGFRRLATAPRLY